MGIYFSQGSRFKSTVHKIPDFNLEQCVIDFDLKKQKSFGPILRSAG